MNLTEKELEHGYRRFHTSQIKGNRTVVRVTHNVSKAGPGQDIYIETPRLSKDVCIVPGSFYLRFDIKCTNGFFKHGISRLLKNRFQIRMSGETIYDSGGENLHRLYEFLWHTKSCRDMMYEYG